MALLAVNEGENAILTRLLNGGSFALSLGLFKNNLTPTDATVFADVTAATFTGYAAVTLTDGSWSIVSGAPCVASYAQQTFTCSASGTAETIYGYYVYRGTTLYWIERFSTANQQSISTSGQTVKVTPRITAKDESA